MATNNSLTPAASASNSSFGSVPGGLSGVQLGNMGAFHYMPPQQHLVKGQLRGLMSNESPFIQQARQAAMELSNARGQANSSYAAGAAQRAAIDAALPIAAQDSETLTRIGLSNAANSQRMAELEAQLRAQSGSGGGIQIVDPYASERQMAHDLQMQRERLAFEGEQGALGREHDFGMGGFNFQNDLSRMGMQHGFSMQELMARFGQERGMAGLMHGYGMERDAFGNQLGMERDILGNQLGMQRDEFGNILGMERDILGNQLGMQRDEFGNILGINRDYMQNQFGMERDRLGYEDARQRMWDQYGIDLGLMGAQHGYGMERDLLGYNMDYRNQSNLMGLRNQYDVGNMYRQYGIDLGLMGAQHGYGMERDRLGYDMGLRNDVIGNYFGNRFGSQRDLVNSRANLYNSIITQGMGVPEFMENPHAFLGFAEFVNGPMWNNIFGEDWGWG